MATVSKFAFPLSEYAGRRVRENLEPGLWARTSTWSLLLLLLYFALDGVSPFVQNAVATRAVSTVSAGGIMAQRTIKLVIFLYCMAFVVKRWDAVREMCGRMRLMIAFPILAILLSPMSQQPSRTISSGFLFLGGTLLLFYIASRYTPNEVLEILTVLGALTVFSSMLLAVALPQYGLDHMGGHDNAWKGVFSAKNYLGNIALFFMSAAYSYSPRTSFLRFLRFCQIACCFVSIAFSRAATAYLLTVVYFGFLVIMSVLHHLRKKDYLLVGVSILFVVSIAATIVVIWPESVVYLLGKDMTFTGRTQIWSAALDAIAKRPLLGYGYGAFWLGLEGESYNVILAATWVLSQAQNGYLDVWLESGIVGLSIVLLVFGSSIRDGLGCLLRSRDRGQLKVVEWYLAILLLTMLYNLDESFLFDPAHLGSMMCLLACTGLKTEWMRLRD